MTRRQGDMAPSLLLFPASLRRDSHQRRLIRYLAERIGGRARIDILAAGEADLPIFNQDLESDRAILTAAIAVHRRFAAADAVIVASPEYNGHVSAYLKNTIDWVSRLARLALDIAVGNPFAGKPLLLCSASTGWSGGVLGLRDARTLFAHVGGLVVGEQICVAHAESWVADGQFSFAGDFADHVAGILDDFLATVDGQGGMP